MQEYVKPSAYHSNYIEWRNINNGINSKHLVLRKIVDAKIPQNTPYNRKSEIIGLLYRNISLLIISIKD